MPAVFAMGLVLLASCVGIAWADVGATYPYVYGVSPSGVTSTDATSTLHILGGHVNDQFFLVHHTYNCSDPPPYELNKRTWLAMLTATRHGSFASAHLTTGYYVVCYRGAHRVNATNATIHAANFTNIHNFSALPYQVMVGGAVNTDLSDFTCCGPFRVGELGNCTIVLRDDLGQPTGSDNTSCRIGLCPFRDGRGVAMTDFTPPVQIAAGTFFLSFLPQGSGCSGTIGVTLDGVPLANKQAYFSVRAGVAAPNRSTSQCEVLVNGTTRCAITQRDYYLNAIQRCVYDSDGGEPVCTQID